jgi:flagellar biosynthesis GTPase FlhF
VNVCLFDFIFVVDPSETTFHCPIPSKTLSLIVEYLLKRNGVVLPVKTVSWEHEGKIISKRVLKDYPGVKSHKSADNYQHKWEVEFFDRVWKDRMLFIELTKATFALQINCMSLLLACRVAAAIRQVPNKDLKSILTPRYQNEQKQWIEPVYWHEQEEEKEKEKERLEDEDERQQEERDAATEQAEEKNQKQQLEQEEKEERRLLQDLVLSKTSTSSSSSCSV